MKIPYLAVSLALAVVMAYPAAAAETAADWLKGPTPD